MGRGEGGEPVRAFTKGRDLVGRDVEPTRIEHVAREQQPGARVVDHDVRGFMAGCRHDLEHPAAEIVPTDPARPVRDPEERRDVRGAEADDSGVGAVAELGVAGVMIAVPVRVRDDQADRTVAVAGAPIGDQPIDGRPDREAAGPAVDQHGAVAAENEIEEGRFEIRPDRLADDEGVGVDPLHLGFGFAGDGAVDPRREARPDRRWRRRDRQRCQRRDGAAPSEVCDHGYAPASRFLNSDLTNHASRIRPTTYSVAKIPAKT